MGVFDGSTKTKTRVSIDRDSFMPHMGALVNSSYTEDAMILGTRNELVTGDITLMFGSNLTRMLAANESDTIGGHLMRSIGGTTTQLHTGMVMINMIAGSMTNTIGPEMRMNVGPVNWTCVAPVTWLNPTATMLNDGNFFETKLTNNTACLTNWTGTISNVTLCVHNAEARVHQGCITVFETANEALKCNQAAMANLTKAMKNNLGALAIGAAVALADVRATEADVGPHVSVPPTVFAN